MSTPSPQEYLDASAAVYNQSIFSTPPGLTLLSVTGPVDPSNPLQTTSLEDISHGFYAQAYEDASNNIIIAYEGSYPNPFDSNFRTPYGEGSNKADIDILLGNLPPVLFNDALKYALRVQEEFGSHPIYVTGHSLGGVEAQYVASQLNFIQGGSTFGAPGVPNYYGNPLGVGPDTFVNYVNWGDPVGNYASDILSVIPTIIPSTGDHFGKVIHLGFLASVLPSVLSLPGVLYELATYHPLPHYASELGKTLSIDIPTITYSNIAFELQGLSQTLPQNSVTPQPVITGPSTTSVGTNTFTPISSWFAATEAPVGSSHHIDHYSVFVVRGSGNLIVNNQAYALGSFANNVTPAQFATATFSAESNVGVSEVAVVAFDDLGNSSVAGDITVTVTAPTTPPQPIVTSDHTPPSIVPPSQQLVTGIGSNPDLTATYLQVTDANSANFTPSQLTYTITAAPSHGYLLKGGSIVNSFTQSDINNGLIEYQENGSIASNDSFAYFVSDPARNRTSDTIFNIQIQAPPSSTTPQLTTNSALSVGQGQTALITDSNLFVSDSGLNPWQIIYTVTSEPANGQILAGVRVIHSFTQQEVDLGLISYQNSANTSGPDDLTFTVSDTVGGTIGETTFGIDVIPKDNLHVDVDRPLYTNPRGSNLTPADTPGWASLLTPDMLSAIDPGVDPANIKYTVLSMPVNAAGILVGHWGTPDNGFVPFIYDREIQPSDLGTNFPHYFSQAEVDAGKVFYRQWDQISSGLEHYGDQFTMTFSVNDNVGNELPTVTLPLVLDPYGLLSNGTFIPYTQPNPATGMVAAIGQTTTIGSGLFSFISPQFADGQITYKVWFTPTGGSLLLNGAALAKDATFTQLDIDLGHLAYLQNGSAVPSDAFGLFVNDPNNPIGSIMNISTEIATTGTSGGRVLTGVAGAETLITGVGNNYFFGDGSTAVSYANSPNGVNVDLAHGTASNGYGGTDTFTNIHLLVGSSHDDVFTGSSGADRLDGGTGIDTLRGGLGDDSYYVDNPNDIVVEAAGGGNDSVYSESNYILASGTRVEKLYANAGPIGLALVGNEIDNRITGNSGNDTLSGQGGVDTLNGGAGNDILRGGVGKDVLNGGPGRDTATYDASTGAIAVALDGSTVVTATLDGATNDTMKNVENVTGGSGGDDLSGDSLANILIGNSGNDALSGNGGNDALDGGNGIDTLTGGAGLDRMNGGAGNDKFIYLALSDSGITSATRDQITGFASGDLLDFTAIDANAGVTGDQVFELDNNNFLAAGEIRQTLKPDGLLLQFNVNADTLPEMSLLLVGRTSFIDAADFLG